jgi:hypothetical protein
VELDAVDTGLAGAPGGIGEKTGENFRQISDVLVVEVGDALLVAELHRLRLARRQDPGQFLFAEGRQPCADLLFRDRRHAEDAPVAVRDVQIAAQELPGLRPAADGQEVDELNEQARTAMAGPRHRLGKFPQARDEAVVADAQKRAGRHVPYPRRLDHQAARLALGEALVPL